MVSAQDASRSPRSRVVGGPLVLVSPFLSRAGCHRGRRRHEYPSSGSTIETGRWEICGGLLGGIVTRDSLTGTIQSLRDRYGGYPWEYIASRSDSLSGFSKRPLLKVF